MNRGQARELGARVFEQMVEGNVDAAFALLEAPLNEAIPFATMGLVGVALRGCPLSRLDGLLERIAASPTEGGWVVVGTALGCHTASAPLRDVLERCRRYVVRADVWYGSDILAERVPGPALIEHFSDTLAVLKTWSRDPNRWVRRAVGVAAHHWTKRVAGERASEGRRLLALLSSMFEERDIDAVKGVGWALKTMGKHYPVLLGEWLIEQVGARPHRALMLEKALTYLPATTKKAVEKAAGR